MRGEAFVLLAKLAAVNQRHYTLPNKCPLSEYNSSSVPPREGSWVKGVIVAICFIESPWAGARRAGETLGMRAAQAADEVVKALMVCVASAAGQTRMKPNYHYKASMPSRNQGWNPCVCKEVWVWVFI